MPVFSLYCANSACGATYQLHAPATEYPPQSCEFCGGPLDEYAGGAQAPSEPVGEERLELVVVSALRASRYPVASLRSQNITATELDARIADAFAEGIPTRVVSQTRQHAALVNWQDLKRLLSAHPVRVQADRQLEPDGWVLIINELGVSVHGWSFEEALGRLAVEAGERARQVLGMSNALPASRDMALRIWMAEAEGELEQLLQGVTEACEPGA